VYLIRSKHDNRSLLALPAVPGGRVRWVDPIEGIAPWTFPTRAGAERARDMNADCGEVVCGNVQTIVGTNINMSADSADFTNAGTRAAGSMRNSAI
jgi:hypothetical protein